MKNLLVLLGVALFAMAGGCRDDQYTFNYSATTTCDVPDQPDVNLPPAEDPVWLYNTKFYTRTTRWPNGMIRVRFPDTNQAHLEKLQELIDEINPLIFPSCRMHIVPWVWHDHQPSITIKDYSFVGEFDGGVTERFPIGSDFTINKTVIHLAHHSAGVRWNVLKRELIHSLGFSTFTYDGGVMDANVQDDEITPVVREFLERLYSMPPGTLVGPGTKG